MRQSNEELFRLLVTNIADYAIFLLDPEGRVASWNAGAERIKGYRADEVLGQHFSRFYPVEDVEGGKPDRELQEARERGRVEDEGWRVRHDGSRFWANVVITALRDEDGELQGFAKVTRDLTERKQAEEQRIRLLLEQAARREAEVGERHYRTLAEAIPQIVWAAGPDGEVDFVSGRWTEYTGTAPERARGRGWQEVLHPEDRRRAADQWSEAVRRGEPYRIEIRLRRADNAYLWHLGRALPLHDEGGRAVRWFGTWTDIDDRHRTEQALREAKEAVEAADRAKDEFLAVLSHELRTPLTPVLASASALLEDPAIPPEVRPVLELTRHNVALEARLIDDLLDMTRISRGELRLEQEIVDAHVLAHRALELCRDEMAAAGLELELDLAAVAHHVEVDASRLQQVFWHLIRNAVKFTPAGGKLIVRSRSAGGRQREQVIVEVIDTGIGIERELLPRIFDAFKQGEAMAMRRFGGLGLGLAISRALVEAHGGRLSVASAGKGQGSTFTVELATVPAPQAAVTGVPSIRPGLPREGRVLKILLVEDDASTVRVMARLLRARHCEVATAGSVAEALAVATGEAFDLIVSDIGLPDGTGWELMRRLREQGIARGIALTGFGMAEDERRSREAGFVAHLTKPVDFQKLEATIQQIVSVI